MGRVKNTKNNEAKFSNRLFTRLYFVLVFFIVLIGSGLEYILNQIDDSDHLSYTKTLNEPVFQLITQRLLSSQENDWIGTIGQMNDLSGLGLMIMNVSDFSSDDEAKRTLQAGETLALFDLNDDLTLFKRIADTSQVLAIPTQLPVTEVDRNAWVLPVFYILFALVVYVLITPFAKKLLQLKQAAVDFGHGDFSTRLDVPASTTLAPIADAFNVMTHKIERLLLTQRDLVNSVSHELRTPLARLKFGFEEVSLHSDDASLNQSIEAMKTDVGELESLIDEMLKYAEASQIKSLSMAPVNLRSMITSLKEVHENEAINVDIEFDSTVDKNLAVVCHEQSLKRAFSNVLRNGVSFAKSRCCVEVSKNSRFIVIRISDDGPGFVGSTEIEHVFEPFYKIDNVHRQSGYGLGLSIAQTIAQKHNGSLAVVEGKLNGACFEFRIPEA